MVLITGVDVEKFCGVDQLCSELKAGIQGGVHCLRELEKKSSDGFGIFLVDATVLWNVRVLWVRCSRFVFNTYHGF